jgi:hypothetical protein
MSCAKYQEALIDLAASGTEPTVDVREHLATCVGCFEQLKQQQSLLASIDSAIRQTANAPLPPALLHRFEARLAQQSSLESASRPSPIYAAAAIATAAALLLLLFPRSRTRDVKRQSIASVEARREAVTQPQGIAPAAPRVPNPTPARRPGKPTSRPPQPSEPEVLVPPEERTAFEHFLSDLNGREDLAVAILKPMQERKEPHTTPVARSLPVQMPDIEIAALAVQPLSGNADR